MRKALKNSIITCVLFFASFAVANPAETFELKPFPTQASNDQEIRQGLVSLYRGNIDESRLTSELEKSKEFQNFLYRTLQERIGSDKNIQVQVEEKKLMARMVREITVKFPSLIQRPSDHASNQVIARIYESTASRPHCDYKYPTTIFLHHILNEVPKIEEAGKIMASGLLNQSAIVVVLHMPHYGDRRQGEEQFLTSDLQAFKLNMAQLILDIHMLRNYLETRSEINSADLSLTGISLGAVMGMVAGAFDQGFSSYGNLVGGADITNILFNRASTRPDSEVAEAMKGIELNEDKMRDELAPIDSMTWMHRYKNKNVFMLNASKDDIINYDISVKPVIESLKSSGNSVQERMNDDTHSPSGNALKKFKNVFLPLMKFIVDGKPSLSKTCRSAHEH